MGSYSIRADEVELAALASRAEAGEEIVLSRDGQAVAKIIPFPERVRLALHRSDTAQPEFLKEGGSQGVIRRGGENLLGLAGTDLAWLDEPLPEDVQRAFGMID